MNCSCIIFATLFTLALQTICEAQETTSLYFSYTNYNSGPIYKQDLQRLDIPFQNVSSSEVIIKQITYTGASIFTLQSRYHKDTLAPGQRDTLHFYRNVYSGLPDGEHHQEWVIALKNQEPVLLHFRSELQTNSTVIAHDTLVIPTVNYGDTVRFQHLIYNRGNQPITFYNKPYFYQLSLLNDYPLTVDPGKSETLYFQLTTAKLMNHYANTIRLETNSDSMRYFKMTYTGDLIAVNKPSIRFDSTTLTLNIHQGDPAEFIFWFVNDGDQPLIISIVKSSCGCLVPDYPREPIKPGERAFVRGRYDSKRLGPINKTMTVHTNASVDPIYLRITGNVALP